MHNVSHTAVYAVCTPFGTCPGEDSAIFAGKQLDPLLAHYWPTADPLRTHYSPFAKNALVNDFSVETDSESESRAMPPRQSLPSLRKAPEPQPAARQMGAVCAVQKDALR